MCCHHVYRIRVSIAMLSFGRSICFSLCYKYREEHWKKKALGAFWVPSEKLLILPKLTFGLFDLSSFFLLAVPLPFVAACNRLSPPIFVRIRRFQRIGLETYRRILFWQSWEPPRRDARPLCCTSSLPALMCASSQPRRARLFETGKAMASFVLSGNERIRLLLL